MSAVASDESISEIKKYAITSKRWRIFAWLTVTALLIARTPLQKETAMAKLLASGSEEVAALDNRLLDLSVNVGVVLAIAVSSLLFLVYQSIGLTLESRLYSITKMAVGPFWIASFVFVAGGHIFALLLGLPTIRTYALWYILIFTIGLLIGVTSVRMEGLHIVSRKSFIRLISLMGYSMLAIVF